MPITVPCVRCKTKFQVPSKFAGQNVTCVTCGCVLKLPSPEVIQAKKQAIAAGKPMPSSRPVRPPSNDEVEMVDVFEGPAPPPVGTNEPPVLSCTHCAGLLYYDPNFAKQTVACPHCGNHLIMPEL